MLTFKIEKTAYTVELDELLVSRLINNKLYSFKVNLEGSINDLAIKANRIAKLDDELIIKFAELSKS